VVRELLQTVERVSNAPEEMPVNRGVEKRTTGLEPATFGLGSRERGLAGSCRKCLKAAWLHGLRPVAYGIKRFAMRTFCRRSGVFLAC
jgi:hypothetical protein